MEEEVQGEPTPLIDSTWDEDVEDTFDNGITITSHKITWGFRRRGWRKSRALMRLAVPCWGQP